jgi:DNA-directed RNA polymerase alpha subunit
MTVTDDQRSEGDLPPELSAPARRALAGAGVTRLEQVAELTETELMKLHGMGPRALQTLRGALAAKGLAFAKSSNVRRLDKESMGRA